MKKGIGVFYKYYNLGELKTTEKDSKTTYIYNSNSTEERIVLKKYVDIEKYSDLIESKNRRSETLFPFFQEVLDRIENREDIKTKSGIEKTDTAFEKLYKYSCLHQNRLGLNFKPDTEYSEKTEDSQKHKNFNEHKAQ